MTYEKWPSPLTRYFMLLVTDRLVAGHITELSSVPLSDSQTAMTPALSLDTTFSLSEVTSTAVIADWWPCWSIKQKSFV